MIYLIKLVVAGMCLAQVTDATSVRTSKKAAALSDLDAWSALESLASRYSMRTGNRSSAPSCGSPENQAAAKSLNQTCQEAQDDIASQLQDMLAAADKMENEEAHASGLAVYNEAMKKADEAFSYRNHSFQSDAWRDPD